jgi:dihydroxyacetone kinase-like protein
MTLTTASLRRGIAAILAKLEVEHQGLTELDGKIGDGDLGITLLKAFRRLAEIAPGLPDDLGQALVACAQGVSAVSSSSFGTLLTTALLAAAKETKGRQEVAWSEVPSMLARAGEAMAKRGRGNLGDKTVLDPIDAAAKAAEGLSGSGEILSAARVATRGTLDAFRDRPNKLGRARIFGDRTIGLDDPGMVAFGVMLDGLFDESSSAA